MRRVYPSEVVRFVAQYFPEAAEEIEPTTVKHFALPWRKKGFVRALVELTEALPQDLINLQADSYCALLSGVAALHTALEGWSHPEEHAIQWLDGIGNPLTIIWRESMPAEHGLRLDDDDRAQERRVQSIQPYPPQAIDVPQSHSRWRLAS